MSSIEERLRHLVALNNPEHGGPYQGTAAAMCMEAMAEAADVIEQLRREGTPGVMHAVDRAFYQLTVAQRDAAWREIAANIKANNPDIDMDEVRTTRASWRERNDYVVVTCGPECSEHHTYVAPCALDGDTNTLAAARAYWRRSHG